MLRALKAALPQVITVYGGVHPTYHYKTILAEEPAVDYIVRGEGEGIALRAGRDAGRVYRRRPAPGHCRLGPLPGRGLAWRREGAGGAELGSRADP